MDAVAYLKAYNRMCESFDSKNNIARKPCVGCPLDDIGRGCHMNDIANNAEECVAAVEKWSKEHPVKTRQSELLKMFPLIKTDENGVITFCPMGFDRSCHEKDNRGWCREISKAKCVECKRKFWLEEIRDGET